MYNKCKITIVLIIFYAPMIMAMKLQDANIKNDNKSFIDTQFNRTVNHMVISHIVNTANSNQNSIPGHWRSSVNQPLDKKRKNLDDGKSITISYYTREEWRNLYPGLNFDNMICPNKASLSCRTAYAWKRIKPYVTHLKEHHPQKLQEASKKSKTK